MKRPLFIAIFVGSNIGGILLHIHRQSQTIKLSYILQKLEGERQTFFKQKQELIHTLHTLHDRNFVKNYAQNTLGLKSVKISQIKKINHDTNL